MNKTQIILFCCLLLAFTGQGFAIDPINWVNAKK